MGSESIAVSMEEKMSDYIYHLALVGAAGLGLLLGLALVEGLTYMVAKWSYWVATRKRSKSS